VTRNLSRRSMKVLIVESGRELGNLWTRALKRQGAQVVFISNQLKAISWLIGRHCDLFDFDLFLKDISFLPPRVLQITEGQIRRYFCHKHCVFI
jgi:hypothetical protein